MRLYGVRMYEYHGRGAGVLELFGLTLGILKLGVCGMKCGLRRKIG